jgi:phage replication-related protein YjqB (UPF0714/DUF867 family)
MADKYSTFDELKHTEQAGAYRVAVRDLGSRVAIVAPHGGGIEPGTSEVSRAIAQDDLSLYLFEGTKDQANSDLHITSTKFNEPECLQLLKGVEVAVTVHGEGGDREVVYLGGRNGDLGERLRAELESHGFHVERHTSPWLQGADPDNICNRCASGMGVQLELSAGLRRTFFESLSSLAGRRHATGRLAQFAQAVRMALQPEPAV